MNTDDTQREDELLEDSQLYPPDEQEVVDAFDAETEEYYPVEYSITSYGADYPVDGLVKRVDAGNIYIPEFQRSFVWNVYRASRFVESLLLGLPVPAIFLSKELDSNKLLVIDGQQRLRTLEYYYNGVFVPTQRVFKLKGVHQRFRDKTYKTLTDDDKLRLDDSIMHAIVVKQEEPNAEDEAGAGPSSAYHIFERLNTGGVLLQPQEIRSCIFHGPLVKLLDALNSNESWRNLFGKVSSRMRDRELILRFFALYHYSNDYSKPMKEFLTRFAKKHRNIEEAKASEFTSLFKETVRTINDGIGKDALKPKKAVNAAICDSIMVGIARRLEKGAVTDVTRLRAAYEELLGSDEYQATVSAGTTNDSNVFSRLRLATQAFDGVR